MTELLAALLGAVVGGALSAWVGAQQTAKVLKHETDLAAIERREAARVDEERRRTHAADQMLAALANYTTASISDWRQWAHFVRVSAPEAVHRDRERKATSLLEAGSRHAYMLPPDIRERWDALTWLVRFNQKETPERSESLRRRDANDLLNYAEYVRRSLYAVSMAGEMPSRFSAPDVRRDDPRPWGVKPSGEKDEPDLTDWFEQSHLVGKVKYTSGEEVWYGPNGFVERLEEGFDVQDDATIPEGQAR